MFVIMEINPNDIKAAEKIFIDGEVFDFERLEFINNLETIDLLAVPGSGKTTALLAKLYCLAKQMPLKNNCGILVLSHTNHAVEEIEKVLKPLCPQLFVYPNFIGTIQAFANRFMANYACFQMYGSYIRKNDDEVSENALLSAFGKIHVGSKLNGLIFNHLYSQFSINAKDLVDKLSFQPLKAKEVIKDLKTTKILNKGGVCNYKLLKNIPNNETPINKFLHQNHKIAINAVNANKYTFCLRYKIDFIQKKFKASSGDLSFSSESGEELMKYFEEVFKGGIFRYSDSISHAKYYLHTNKEISNILQNRFKFVFIDEMQDLDSDQIDLIESIFFTEKSQTIIQRIGDKNQAIYSNKSISDEVIWKTRNEIDSRRFPRNLSLNNSHRLTDQIAKLVDCFVLNRDKGYKVIGKSKYEIIVPHLLVYDDEKDGEKLKLTFSSLIQKYNLHSCPKNLDRGFHIIGWTTEKEDNLSKWHLKKLFPEYSKEKTQKKEDFECLAKYVLLHDTDKKTLESIRKSLLNGITRVLRIEQTYFDVDKKAHFGKSNLIKLIKEKGENYYNGFNQKLFNWCFQIVTKGDYQTVLAQYQAFIEEDLVAIIPEFKINKSSSFVKQHFDYKAYEKDTSVSRIIEDGLNIKLSSVHAVKGQTHCATMYVETEYFNYETAKLKVTIEPGSKKKSAILGSYPLFFKEQNFSHLDKALPNGTLKMMYVGFSRPTHLLCFAVQKKNVFDDIEYYKEAGWEVIEI